MEHILIKGKAEDCWDLISFSEVQHNTCDEVGDVNNGAIIGTEVKVTKISYRILLKNL